MAFIKSARLNASNEKLDGEEARWWNKNADIIERIWGEPCKIIVSKQLSYLKSVAHLIRVKYGVEHIYELACGSGWPGRVFAKNGLNVTGVDQSSEQIILARKKADESELSNVNYKCGDLRNGIDEKLTVQCVFYHCGLHHYSNNEVQATVQWLSKENIKFFIAVEPIYFSNNTLFQKFIGKFVAKFADKLCDFLLIGLTQDKKVLSEVSDLIENSNKNEWFFSPKEMPFEFKQFLRFFEGDYELLDRHTAMYLSLIFSQKSAMYKLGSISKVWVELCLSFFVFLDALISRTHLLEKVVQDYLFYVFIFKKSSQKRL
jgi:2-polyprenyl-3-methyl-5-hydroxy-6-metoxy-1,4-benzoquinol methylase